MKCLKDQCRSPVACGGFGYCREINFEIRRLRLALEKIAFITGGIDTPATSNAAHYEAVNALKPPAHTSAQ